MAVKMNIKTIILKILTAIRNVIYRLLDILFIPFDRKYILRTRNISQIPTKDNRRGGKQSYAEWAHVIGIFQTLMFLNLEKKDNNMICDVGCGTGLLANASKPFLGENGKYFGIDVRKKDIEFCRRHYRSSNYEFIHFDVNNPAFAADQESKQLQWPIESNYFDLISALSVWTHLNEEEASFYFNEICRVLKPEGKAIVTFFLLDEIYEQGFNKRKSQYGEYHMTFQDKWIFDQPSYGSNAWFHPKWAKVPEDAIGITNDGLARLTSNSGLRLIRNYQGNWKEVPGAYFQDVLIFQKA